MNKAILISFLQAGKAVLGGVIGQVEVDSGTEKGKLQPELFTSNEISVLINITGQLQGVVVYGMTRDAAIKIASGMMGMDQLQFDAMVASAVGELGNMISGHALAELSKVGYNCDLTPPKIRRGAGIVKLLTPAVTIPYHTPYGRLDVSLALVCPGDLKMPS